MCVPRNVKGYLWPLVTETLSLDSDEEILGFGQLGSKVTPPPPAARRLSTDSADCITLDSDSEEETRHVAKMPGMSDGSPLTVSSTAISQGLTRDNNRSPVIITIDDEIMWVYLQKTQIYTIYCLFIVSLVRQELGG